MPVLLQVTPLSSLIDHPVDIRISGLRSNQEVTLRAQTTDAAGVAWQSHATFVANSYGSLDVGAQKPVTGTYAIAHPTGLFWSMAPVQAPKGTLFAAQARTPVLVEVSAEVDGRLAAHVQCERWISSPDVVRVSLREQGLVGTFFYPQDSGPCPGALIVGGSDGGMRQNEAALLASWGYATLALAYFGLEGLPAAFSLIPLEYFQAAISWLQAQPVVRADRLAAVGLSRGGELALLLGATFPALKAVVAGSPSAVLFAGVGKGNDTRAAWTYHGAPLPFVAPNPTFGDRVRLAWQRLAHPPYRPRDYVLTALRDRERLAPAIIPVERINGPLLLISGQDDPLWPSDLFAEMIVERLAQSGHPHPYRHLCYLDAGHRASFPYGLPSLPPAAQFGGSIQGNAVAVAHSWPRILTFLETSLGAPCR